MNDIFTQTFGSMFDAVAKIFIIALGAGILVKRDIIKPEYIKGMSELTVKILLPALIFSNILSTFKPESTPGWWVLPLIGFFAPIFFLGAASLFFLRNFKQHLNKLPVAAFQNAGYLVLPVGQILYPDNFSEFALYNFLFILGFNPSLWSVGKLLITKTDEHVKFDIKDIVTPPLIVNIVALSLVFLNLHTSVPEIILDPVKLMGSATVPMATFILGATLGTVSLKQMPSIADILKVLFVKFAITPAVAFIILYYFNIAEKSPILADFIIIEASAAPAANLILMVKKYGGDAQKTGSLMLVAYLAAIPLMPLWIALWRLYQ